MNIVHTPATYVGAGCTSALHRQEREQNDWADKQEEVSSWLRRRESTLTDFGDKGARSLVLAKNKNTDI
jgi:hypothetical protein